MKPVQQCLVVLLVFCNSITWAQNTIMPFGSGWRYLDAGVVPTTDWYSVKYNHNSWKLGKGVFGYGDGSQTTLVSYGPNAGNKNITTYFRKTIYIDNYNEFANFIIESYRDDGIIIYLNGVLKRRNNLPSGPITSTTPASSTAVDDGQQKKTWVFPASDFVAGNNVIAVEVHQASATDPDMRFDLSLSGNKPPVAVIAQPAIQPVGATQFTLDGRASYDPDGLIKRYRWTKLSGPTGDTILSPSTNLTTVAKLTPGTYVYQLRVTDNRNAASTTNVTVIIPGASMLFVDWSTVTIPADGLPDGRRFANDKLRSSTAYDPFSKTIVDGKMHFIVDSQTPVDPKISSAQYHYRSEFTEWPWMLKLPEGTEQWLGWSYYFAPDYVLPVNPISIFQNHPATSNGDPLFQLEVAKIGQVNDALGGEIQIINNCVSPYVRLFTPVRPLAGDTLDIIMHIVYGTGANGKLEIWLNGDKLYNYVGSTVFPTPENWGGNNKWGIYHHTWTNPSNVQESIAAGHTRFELDMGNLRQITRGPADPEYLTNSKALIDPAQDYRRVSGQSARRINKEQINENEIIADGFSIYPVPVNVGDNLFVTAIGKPCTFQLISQTGQTFTLNAEPVLSNRLAINTTGLSPGVYWLQCNMKNSVKGRKVVIR